jgi:hemoglobin/transferrin/lactoferrin receptor protein
MSNEMTYRSKRIETNSKQRHLKVRYLIVLICSCWSGMSVVTDARSQEAGSLKDVVISGSRTEQNKDEIPATVEVINRRQLEANVVNDIRDVVRDIPNASVERAPARFSLAGSSTGRGGNVGFNIRGLDGNRVLILVDGLRVPRSYAFGSNTFGRDYVDVTLLKQVEIIKGPGSALYGSDGLAGLVNFITLQPEDYLEGRKTLGGRASLTYSGDDKGTSLSAALAGKASETAQWLFVSNFGQASALDNAGINNATNIDRTTPNPQKDRNVGILAKLILTPTNNQRHTLAFEHADRNSRYELLSTRAKQPFAGTSAQIANAVLNTDASSSMSRNRFSWDAKYKLDAAVADSAQTIVSFQNANSREYAAEDRNLSADRVRDVTYGEKTTQAGVKLDKLIRTGSDSLQKITYGVDYVSTSVRNNNTGVTPPFGETFPIKRFPDTQERSIAAYIQDEFVFGSWSVIPGVRWDHYAIDASQVGFSPPSATPAASLSGSALSPKLGVISNLSPNWSIYGNYAAGFRAPNAGQVNAFFENLTSFYKTIPNGNLRPEKSQNLELGVRARFDNLSLDVAGFSGAYKDLIENSAQVGGAGVVGNPTIFQSINVGKATIKGFEAKINYDWATFAGGTWSTPLVFGQTKGTNGLNGRPLNSVDPATLGVGLAYRSADWTARLNAKHRSGKSASDIDGASLVNAPAAQFTTAAATTLDLFAQWRIRKDLRVNLAILNATNKKYWLWNSVRGLSSTSPIVDAYTQPNRSVQLSIVGDL